MKTAKLYQENVYLREAEAQILYTKQDEDGLWAALDRTPFFPEGGGQSADTGTLQCGDAVYRVDDVQEDGEVVLHHLVSPAAEEQMSGGVPAQKSDSANSLQAGDTVTLTIDWDHRFENMQRHAGEHILSGRIWALFG
ncbi:MAG: alanyl-tRNA editing protein, partial [Firmicutes bacterium]|nr:alanyl-tRNA editing protein [Bacillota bacterium]